MKEVFSEREVYANGELASSFKMIGTQFKKEPELTIDDIDPLLVEQIREAAECMVFGKGKKVYYAQNKEDAERAQKILDAEEKGFKFAKRPIEIVKSFS